MTLSNQITDKITDSQIATENINMEKFVSIKCKCGAELHSELAGSQKRALIISPCKKCLAKAERKTIICAISFGLFLLAESILLILK